jgi:putative transposase
MARQLQARRLEYEEVYLKPYDTVEQARSSLARYLEFYNRLRPHSSLDRRTPDEAYFHPRRSRRRRHKNLLAA